MHTKEFKPTLAGYRDRCEQLEREIAVLKSDGPNTNEVTQWLIETAELFAKTAGMLIEMRGDDEVYTGIEEIPISPSTRARVSEILRERGFPQYQDKKESQL